MNVACHFTDRTESSLSCAGLARIEQLTMYGSSDLACHITSCRMLCWLDVYLLPTVLYWLTDSDARTKAARRCEDCETEACEDKLRTSSAGRTVGGRAPREFPKLGAFVRIKRLPRSNNQARIAHLCEDGVDILSSRWRHSTTAIAVGMMMMPSSGLRAGPA